MLEVLPLEVPSLKAPTTLMAGTVAPPALQRATGELRVGLKKAAGGTVLDDLRQSGCLRARFPRRLVPDWMDAVLLNTSGGIAGGDRLDLRCTLGAGAQATIAAQAAERFYRCVEGGGPSVVRNAIRLDAGASVEWLPQETILFDGCALDRRLDVDLAADARLLAVETLVFGREAMGERVRRAGVRDGIRVRRAGVPVLHEAVRLQGAVDALLRRATVAEGALALGTVVYVAPDAGHRLAAVRDRLQQAAGFAEAAASAWNGMVVTRMLARNGALLRRAIIAVLPALRDGRPVPRVWGC